MATATNTFPKLRSIKYLYLVNLNNSLWAKSLHQDHYLLLCARRNMAVRKKLHEGGMRAQHPRMEVTLTPQHCARRLLENTKIGKLATVLFPDESTFTLSTSDKHDRVWRRREDQSGYLTKGSLTAVRYRDEIL